MTQATVGLLNSYKLGDFYFTKDARALALKYVQEDLYEEVGPFDCDDTMTNEEVAEDLFDMMNNPGRQPEREARYGRGRSLSVGDIVVVRGELLVCRPQGWETL